MDKLKSGPVWVTIFGLLFLLSMDFWLWSDEAVLSWLGLPSWVYYFILIQLVFAGCYYWFSALFWTDDAE